MADNTNNILMLTLFSVCSIEAVLQGCISYRANEYKCLKCKTDYYLLGGYCFRCNIGCKECNGYNCTLCPLGTYGNICQHSCTQNCLKECLIDSGYCVECKPQLYGPKCEENCTLCIEERCNLRECSHGCKHGYYEYKSDEATSCKECPQNCKICKTSSECSVCDDGFYLKQLNSVSNLKRYVFCGKCPAHDPSCQDFCTMQNCNQCQVQNGSLICRDCHQGYKFNGEICALTTNSCSENCLGDCGDTGICMGNCSDGWSGERCLNSCSSLCKKCDKNNKDICQRCRDDYYTTSCRFHCPTSCTKEIGTQTCRIEDGYCLNRCDPGLWGEFCNMSCSSGCMENHDNSRVCDRTDGRCENGCMEGFVGHQCDIRVTDKPVKTTTEKDALKPFKSTFSPAQTMLSTPTSRENLSDVDANKQTDDKNILIIGSGAAGGVLLVIVISVSVVCLIKRRNLSDNSTDVGEKEIKDKRADVNAEFQTSDAEGEMQDYVYAKPNKKRRNKTDTKSEKGNHKKLYDNVENDLKVEQIIVEETDTDTVQLEDLEEGATSFTNTDFKIPTADTYYNTTGLVKSRIQICNLLEHIKNKTDYEKEFEKLPKCLTRTCNEALKPRNRARNRYNGIYAYDATRVVLQSKKYVNANYVDGHDQSSAYIASLGPTKSTMDNFESFWEMAWQENTDKIIMLTNLEEGEKIKCEQYWPEQGAYDIYEGYKVACRAEHICSEFTVRDFAVTRGTETREVTHFHYTAWPDKAAPDNVASLLEFRDKVEQTRTKSTGPIMVHCSAGIGRTGTYIALDILIKEGRQDDSVDIFGCVNALRAQRVQMVQNVEQYIYLHHCVLYALTCDTEQLPVTAVPHYMTDERMSIQHQAYVNMQLLANDDKALKAKIQSRKEIRKGADIPGEDHRVRLTLTKHDYINAVYLNGYQKVNKFIAAQTPLPNTLEDFVSMLYQEKCPCVVCLDEENVKDKLVAQYLPPANKVSTFGHYQVACMHSDQRQDVVIRELKISRIGSPLSEGLSVFHYQFRGWASTDCVPPRILAFLKMVIDVDKIMQRLDCEQPLLVHCATGAERSGLYCAVSILLEKVAVEKDLSVLNTICQVCSRRTSAFRDIEHLRFCYNCVEEVLEMSDTYYNTKNM